MFNLEPHENKQQNKRINRRTEDNNNDQSGINLILTYFEYIKIFLTRYKLDNVPL